MPIKNSAETMIAAGREEEECLSKERCSIGEPSEPLILRVIPRQTTLNISFSDCGRVMRTMSMQARLVNHPSSCMQMHPQHSAPGKAAVSALGDQSS